jgi:hypothetical protein
VSDTGSAPPAIASMYNVPRSRGSMNSHQLEARTGRLSEPLRERERLLRQLGPSSGTRMVWNIGIGRSLEFTSRLAVALLVTRPTPS